MSENCSAAKQEVGGVSRAFERLLDKITDRLLPDEPKPDEPENGTHDWMKGSAIFVGMILWFSYGLTHKWGEVIFGTGTDGGKNSKYFVANLPFNLTSAFYIISVLSLFILGIFIFKSFNRGRPLSFFFWGLIFPSMALNILEFTFR